MRPSPLRSRRAVLVDLSVDGRAVLLRTGQDALFGADDYGANGHPLPSRSGAESLRDRGVGTFPMRAYAEIDGP